jgi:hypothetical protein
MAKQSSKNASTDLNGDGELQEQVIQNGRSDDPALEAYKLKFLSKKGKKDKVMITKNMHVSRQSHVRLTMLTQFSSTDKRPLSLQQVLDNILQEHFTTHAPVLKVIAQKTIKDTQDALDL